MEFNYKEKLNYDINNFAKALTSNERLKILIRDKSINISDEYIKEWKNRKSIVDENSFKEKLQNENLTEIEFNYAIKDLDEYEKDVLYENLKTKDWYVNFQQIINYSDDELHKIYDFSYAIRHFVLWAKSQIENKICTLSNILIDKEVYNDLSNSLSFILIPILRKCLVFELNISKNKLELKGETPEERFKYFIKTKFSNEKIILFYNKYPVAARLLTIKTEYFINHVVEALNRLDKNGNEIKKYIKVDITQNEIKKIIPNEGDTHQKGKSVIQIIFKDDAKIIYKPKNLCVSEKYNELINWVNRNSKLLDMKTNLGVYKQDFSFESFVPHNPCESKEQIQNYYIRFGQIIGIAYFIGGTDLHLENIIANGEYPIIIDIETLFKQDIPIKIKNTADLIAMNENINSVISTGLLPFKALNENKDGKGIDLSALNGGEQKLPHKILMPTANFTDEMRFEYQEYTRPGAQNLPFLHNEEVAFKKYTKYIIEGFRNMCMFVLNNKEKFLNKVDIFNHILVRQVLKDTNKYANMLDFSYHPKCMKDFLEREKLFENIWGYPYKNKSVIKYEVEDMLFEDIPIFFTYNDSKNLITSDGTIIRDYYNKTSLDMVKEKIKYFNNEDLEKQISYIIVSFGEYEKTSIEILKKKNININKIFRREMSYEKTIYLDKAIEIGNRMLKEAFHSKDSNTINWNDIICDSNQLCQITPLNEGFYSGLSGIALFFHELYGCSQNEEYEVIAKKIINNAFSKALFSKQINITEGIASLIFPLTIFYKDTDDEIYKQNIDKSLTYVDENLDQITSIDWLSGLSGLIQSTLNVYSIMNSEKYLRISEKLGCKLVELINKNGFHNMLGGMAHGASGITVALFRLGYETKKSQFTNLGIKLLEYDRTMFDSKNQGWIDKRNNELAYKWCHGSTGIGLSRIMIQKYYNDPTINEEIELSVSLASNNLKIDDCLCHGNFGDIELLLNYYETNTSESFDLLVNKKITDIFCHNDYRIRSLGSFISLGIYTGLSGVGYELLRLYSPSTVPSILKLQII